MPKDKRPILFFGSPEDVRSVDGKLVARFEGDAANLFYGDTFYFELECDADTADAMRAKDSFTYFGVIALITSFEATDSDVVVGGDTERRRQFRSRGRCLALGSRQKIMHPMLYSLDYGLEGIDYRGRG
jgi:hypothetical protein